MTYINNVITYLNRLSGALLGIEPKPTIIERKDPNGIIARDLKILRSYADTKPYKVGDSLELVAYRQGQLDLIKVIETKLLARRANGPI